MIRRLYQRLSAIPQIEAIALGGSRSCGNEDEWSDYDLYVYYKEPVPAADRRAVLEELCREYEFGNHFFEDEDNCILKDGTFVDIIYRELSRLEQLMPYIVEQCHALNGYTTCFWHNLLCSEIICDKNGLLTALQRRFTVPYPPKLKENIIRHNLQLLYKGMPSYDKQIGKAIRRKDLVSVNHRTTAFLESYFDILFALNEKTHPGEKRLIQLCKRDCPLLPEGFEENLQQLFQHLYTDNSKTAADLANIIQSLDKLLKDNGITD